MKTVEVKTGKPYNIIIGDKIICEAGKLIAEVTKAQTAAVITDDKVDCLYGESLEKSLKSAGFDVIKFVFKNGEKSKNITVFSQILEFLALNHLTRSDCVVALGGGVVGDMAGFCAATYLRGVDFIQIPTTLLACVDSSVGGKTAIDLEAGKNLAGVFYQPKAVICDYGTLKTLDDNVFSDGMAEVIKYGAVFEYDFFNFLKENNAKDNLEYIIEKCVCFKRDVVTVDEFDNGVRGLLNFGHTVGHAIEKCSGFEISHGSAVAIGMVVAARGAYNTGISDIDFSDELIELLEKYNLPVKSPFGTDDLISVMLSDKKRSGDEITLIIPSEKGRCKLYKTEIKELRCFISKGLN